MAVEGKVLFPEILRKPIEEIRKNRLYGEGHCSIGKCSNLLGISSKKPSLRLSTSSRAGPIGQVTITRGAIIDRKKMIVSLKYSAV